MELPLHFFQLAPAAVGLNEVFRRALHRHEHALANARSASKLLRDTHGVTRRRRREGGLAGCVCVVGSGFWRGFN